MTVAELARERGISAQSAARLVRRKRWRRIPGNDGDIRVLVPDGGSDKSIRPRKNTDTVAGLLSTIKTLQTALQREQGRADRLDAELSALRTASRWHRLRRAWRGGL